MRRSLSLLTALLATSAFAYEAAPTSAPTSTPILSRPLTLDRQSAKPTRAEERLIDLPDPAAPSGTSGWRVISDQVDNEGRLLVAQCDGFKLLITERLRIQAPTRLREALVQALKMEAPLLGSEKRPGHEGPFTLYTARGRATYQGRAAFAILKTWMKDNTNVAVVAVSPGAPDEGTLERMRALVHETW